MKQDKILEAIGQLDEALLAESEKFIYAQPKRMISRAMTLAAIVAMLALTAVGAGFALKSKPVDAKLSQMPFQGYYTDDGATGIEVALEMEIREDLPVKLETVYAPQPPAGWVPGGVIATREGDPKQMALLGEADYNRLRCLWIPEGDVQDQRVMYMQMPVSNGYNRDRVYVETLGPVAEGRALSDSKQIIAGIEAYVLTVGQDKNAQWPENAVLFGHPMPDGERRFYWTDGAYVFLLACPLGMTDGEVAAFMETLQPVADVSELF